MEDRHFSTGSIEAPDPFDKHLDQIGFYRKHTARDATSLFRVISEQMYGAQIHHLDVRDFCVRYMGMYQSNYEKVVDGTGLTFEEYLTKLSKPRTFGTLTELTALAYRFKRNVFMFEGCNMGDWFVYEKEFEETFLVFYSPPRHFDTVFPKAYIESVAFCQSLTYEILYSHVFKLPDVVYAVERMLHDPPEGTHISQIEVSPFDESQESLTLSDGRHFILDHADETECILKNYLFCHFHNKRFEKMIELEEFAVPQQLEGDTWTFTDHVYASSLPRRNISCVRQLLDENIKPFSYKVAKALDTHIYRNIEFDVWGDARRNARFRQWSQGDSLQVGVKCIVDNIDPNQKSSYCHIQEMHPQKNSCVVYVETLGAYRVVPISSIKTIPSVTWMLPTSPQHRYRDKKRKRNNSGSNNHVHSNELCKLGHKISKVDDDESYMDIRYFTKPMHIPSQYQEYITQPQYASSRWSKTEETTGNNNQPNNKNVPPKKSNQNQGSGEKSVKAENNNNKSAPAKRPNPTTDPKTTGKAGTELATVEFEPRVHYGSQTNMPYVDRSNATVVFSHMENLDMEGGPMAQGYGGHSHVVPLQSMIKNKELLRSTYPPNLNAQPSVFADGSDLRGVDHGTLRFFYNLGHEYMRYMHYRFPRKAVSAMFQGILNDTFPTRQNRYSGGYYDNFHDMGELANDFSRQISFAGRDQQHTNKPNDGQNQYRRMYNPNTVNAHKKNNTRNYRVDYNKGKRQFSDSDASKTNQPKTPETYGVTPTAEYSEAAPTADPNVRSNEYEPSPTTTMMPPPQPIYSTDGGEPGGMYGVPFVYTGMYPPVNDNFAPYPVPGGMMYAEPVNIDNELTQTYPYYNPHGGFYYPNQMPPLQIGQPQGSWYPPSIVPIHQTLPMPIQQSGSTLSNATLPSTPSYGNYIVSEPELPATPFTPNEQ